MGCFPAAWNKLKSWLGFDHEAKPEADELTPISRERQVHFKMETLVAATKNFHPSNKLGEGGFGPVYKGVLEDGTEIAVKKLSLGSRQGKKEFLNEVKLVAKVQHRNLVSILGCCVEGAERMLVYEYLPNHSLDKILFDRDKRKQLGWQQRYSIILGMARGLLYLHEDSQACIIHRDIKASNILLDDKWHPKIADFGLARLYPEDKTHVTTRVVGTYGYMAPEYALHGKCSLMLDIYSFGVLLLEIVSGRKNTDYNLLAEAHTLLSWAWKLYKKGNLQRIVDPNIISVCPLERVIRCIHVGLLCTQADRSLRPPISSVTLMLSSHSVRLPPLTKPGYMHLGRDHHTSSTSHFQKYNHNCSSQISASAQSSFSALSSDTPLVPS
eukprot:TRINITY_DN5157_c0_g1_i5.p1 TRINITY_DN5157_c0_g1~~TRINITY_DN5157_c0_g1_i5.p1  ORF type:complete len:383 (+),score=49.27 TRINITY_DN5157_c0_g1_i5:123-1271(+)